MKNPWESKKSRELAEGLERIRIKTNKLIEIQERLRAALLPAILSGRDPKDPLLPGLVWLMSAAGMAQMSLKAVLTYKPEGGSGRREVRIPAEDLPDDCGPFLGGNPDPRLGPAWKRSRTIRNKRIERAIKHTQPNVPD